MSFQNIQSLIKKTKNKKKRGTVVTKALKVKFQNIQSLIKKTKNKKKRHSGYKGFKS